MAAVRTPPLTTTQAEEMRERSATCAALHLLATTQFGRGVESEDLKGVACAMLKEFELVSINSTCHRDVFIAD